MSQLEFDEKAARQLEAVYLIADGFAFSSFVYRTVPQLRYSPLSIEISVVTR